MVSLLLIMTDQLGKGFVLNYVAGEGYIPWEQQSPVSPK